MKGIKPDPEMWVRVNQAIFGENAAVAIVTMISGMCGLLIEGGIAEDEESARIHLAAMILSPDDGRPVGSLLPRLQAECAKLDDGKWWQ